ncbi:MULTISPECIES: hypothetical protein [unclassified Gilliamella]|uniref:hypothetical protein n=1 Tax=unclassified Gilliamella TaxID=2685620 RepID=UPI00226AEB8E|nr:MULTISPECIES: hypothetical protein [unclassified Gilliamella]MCX8642061.1 hypothetical protein [Gilliamella sp. B3835]MCX8707247.1 hypothetical protein [Gilliamella sp. B3783]MCX8710844.1 hypothetical protein [Gilliamella sp. B3780]MCX8714012.1 hypothetical protein [Gilliamella sp. B3781]MCX8716229.1 hypothetical protein [Gilliamella sp. B3784]
MKSLLYILLAGFVAYVVSKAVSANEIDTVHRVVQQQGVLSENHLESGDKPNSL